MRIGPLFRYYFIDDRFAPFIELEYSHDIYNLPSDRNVDYLGYSIGFGIGLNYFMTKYFALEPYINYQYSLNKYWDYNYDEIPTGSYYYHIEATSIGFRLNYFIK